MGIGNAETLFNALSKMPHEREFLKFIRENLGPVERVHFDFKEKTDRRSATLSDSDRKNLAKAVSGFANAGGGVLIWGIENQTLKEKPIATVREFCQNLLNLASATTDPLVSGIDASIIVSEDDSAAGYALVFIPESMLPPHRVILNNDLKNHYYDRSGDSFVVASHSRLEDMFGRRPKPMFEIYLKGARRIESESGRSLYVALTIELKNVGRGIAKAPVLVVGLCHGIIHFHQSAKNSFFFRNPAEKKGRFDYEIESDEFEADGKVVIAGSDSEIIHSGLSAYFTILAVEINRFGDLNGKKGFSEQLKCQISADGIQPQMLVLSLDLDLDKIPGP